MSQTVLFIKLLLVHYATQINIEANCSEDISLQCKSVDFNTLSFVSVVWYKLQNQKKNGIIRRNKGSEATQNYNFTRMASFGENYSLLLPSVMPEDSGNYQCAINAKIGEKNLYLNVDLTVDDCVTQAQLTSETTVFNITESTPLCQKQPKDLPVMWSVIGYMAVGLTKIILCLISIWVIHSSKRYRSSRQRQRMW